MAEAEGFEPPDPCGSLAFKASAFGRSATLPPRTVPAARRPSRGVHAGPDNLRKVTTGTHHAPIRRAACGAVHPTGKVIWFAVAEIDGSVASTTPYASSSVWWDHAGQQEARMRFDENADLDTSNVDDLRGGGGGGGGPLGGRVAVGGGGLGIVGLIIFFLISLLGGGGACGGGSGGGLPFPGGLGGVEQGQTADTSQAASACQTGQQANTQLDCEVVAVVNSLDGYWTDAFARSGQTYQPPRTNFFSGGVSTGCGSASSRHRAVLLPGRQRGLHRPLVLQGAGDPLRRPGRHVLPRLRDRPRVRPPHPGPARHQQPGAARRHRPDLRFGAPRAAGRLLRRRVGQPRRQRCPTATGPAADHRRQPGGRDRRAGHRRSDRRRLHPDPTSAAAGWTRASSPTAARRSARSGGTTGYKSGDPAQCDTFARGVNLG